jgi:macrolide-specific efflux system membrane fusion protein
MTPASLLFIVFVAASLSAQTGTPKSDGARSAPDKSAADKSAAEKAGGDKMVVKSALVTIIEEAEIPAPVEGVLSAVETREGQMVDAHAVVARIEDAEVRLTHERARTEFEIARKQAGNDLKVRLARKSTDVARAELKRAIESVEKYKKSVSDTEIDRLRLAADKAELEIEQALHEQETARLTSRLKEIEMELANQAVDRRLLTSPISGMVVQVNLHQGEWVQPGKTVVRVLRVDRLRVEGFVAAELLSGDLVGRRATLTVDLPGRAGVAFEGAVVFVSPEINPVNQQVRVWAEVDNRQLLLRPGLRGNLTIHPEPAQTAKRENP